MKLKLAEVIFTLYIKKDRFIAYFKTFEEAEAFAKKYYHNIEAHIEPNWVFYYRDAEE